MIGVELQMLYISIYEGLVDGTLLGVKKADFKNINDRKMVRNISSLLLQSFKMSINIKSGAE